MKKLSILFVLFFLLVAGSAHAAKVITVTSATTTTADDQTVLCDASGGAFTITLVDCRTNTKVIQRFKKIDNSANACTLDGTGLQTIDDQLTLTLTGEYNTAILQCDGANWQIHSGTVTTITGSGGILPIPNGGTSLSSLGDDKIILGDSATTATARSIPDCDDAGGNHLNYDTATNTVSCGTSGGASGYATIQDEGSALTQRSAVNFTGAGVTCVDNAGSTRTDCTINLGSSVTFHGARLRRTANQTFSHNTEAAIAFTAESWDTDGYHDNSTNNSRITIPDGLSGYYTCRCDVRFVGDIDGVRQLKILLNNTTQLDQENQQPDTTNAFYISAEATYFLSDNGASANDYVECLAFHAANNNLDVQNVAEYSPVFVCKLEGQ